MAGVTGVNGANATLLTYTNDVAIDIYGNIYVADTDNQRIQRFPPNSLISQKVAGTGAAGSGFNQLNFPRAIFVAGDVLYISDIYNYRIQRYAYNASSGTAVAGGKDQISSHCATIEKWQENENSVVEVFSVEYSAYENGIISVLVSPKFPCFSSRVTFGLILVVRNRNVNPLAFFF